MQVAILGYQIYIPTRFYLAVLVDDDVLAVFTLNIFLVRSMQRNIAVLCGCLAINDDFAVYCFQCHVLFRRHGVRIRTVIADMDIAFTRLHGYASVFRGYRLHNVHIAFSYVNGHILAGGHIASVCVSYDHVARSGRQCYVLTGCNIFTYRNVSRSGLHRYAAVFRVHLFADRNIARFRLHRHIFDYGYVLIQRDVALSTCLCVQRSLGCYVVCHVQVAILGYQIYIPTRFYLAVLVDDDVLAVFTLNIFLVRSMQRNIAVLRGCLAINDDFAVYCFQRHVFLRRHGLRIRTIAADMNIAIHSLYVHISIS